MILDRPYQERVIDSPEPGDFVVRAYRGGPWLPARIERHELGAHALRHGWKDALTASVFGQAAPVMNVWNYGQRVSDFHAAATLYLDAVGKENLYAPTA